MIVFGTSACVRDDFSLAEELGAVSRAFVNIFALSSCLFLTLMAKITAASLVRLLLTQTVCDVFQARQVLEREFNNLLALGTDRRLEEVTSLSLLLLL